MCCGVRCTERRMAASSLIFTRPRSARRRRVSRLSSFMSLLLLRFFQRNLLVRILHALALVRLRRPETADLGRRLTDALPIDALDDDFRLARRFDGHAIRDRVIDQMRKTQRQRQTLGLYRSAMSDADELELFLVALGHARDHIREVRSSGARDGVQPFRGRIGLDGQMLVLELDLDAALEREGERTLRTLNRDGVRTNRGAHTLRQIYRLFCDSRHSEILNKCLRGSMERHYWTTNSTSPPVPAARAWASDMMPFGVETTATPKPPSTLGNSSLPR